MKTTLLACLALSVLFASACRRSTSVGHSHGGHSHEAHPHGDDSGHDHGEGEEAETAAFTLMTSTHELFVELDLPVAGAMGSHHAHVTRLADNAPATGGSFGVAFVDAANPDRVVQSYAVDGPARTGIFTPSGQAPMSPGDYRLIYRYQAGDEIAEWDAGLLAVGREAIAPEGAPEGEISFLKETSWYLPFRVRKPERRALARSLTMPAQVGVDPRLSAGLAAPAAGRVLWSSGEELMLPGQRVESGALVGRLVPDSSYASWNALDLELRRARIDSDRAIAELARLEGLLADGLVSDRRVLDAKAERDKAEASLASARREREATGGASPTIELRAPSAGIVTELLVQHGARAEAGQPLATIASSDRVLVHGTLRGATPDELSRVSFARARTLGGRSEIDLLEAGATLFTSPELVDARRAGLAITWSVPNDGRLLLGEFLELNLGIGDRIEQLTIPIGAVVEINTRPHAFVQVTGESFEQRSLELGTSDGERVAVLGGLSADDLVVTEGGFEVYVTSLAGTVESHRH